MAQIFTTSDETLQNEQYHVIDSTSQTSFEVIDDCAPSSDAFDVVDDSATSSDTLMQLGSKGDKGDKGDSATGFISGTKFIPVGATVQVDMAQALDLSVEWVLVAKDAILDKLRRRRVSGLITGDFHTFDIYGNQVPFKPLFVVTNGVMILSVINNHINPITIHYSRASIS